MALVSCQLCRNNHDLREKDKPETFALWLALQLFTTNQDLGSSRPSSTWRGPRR